MLIRVCVYLTVAVFSSLVGSRWLLKEELGELLVETISDHDVRRNSVTTITSR